MSADKEIWKTGKSAEDSEKEETGDDDTLDLSSPSPDTGSDGEEIDLDKINKITGMDITIVTDTNSDEEAFTLLKEFGMPFSENGAAKKEAEEAEQKRQEAIKREAEEAARAEAAEEEEKKEADRRAALSQEERDKEDAEAKANEDTDSEENKDNNEESAEADDSENK